MNNENEMMKGWKEPEALVGFGLDWSKYVPTGGWEWNHNLRTNLIPSLEASLKEIAKAKVRYETINASIGATIKNLDSIRSCAVEVRNFFEQYSSISERQSIESVFALVSGKEYTVWDWLEQVENVVKTLKGHTEVHSDPTAVRETIDDYNYISALIEYLRRDIEVDALLWGVHYIDIKYKTKIFRVVYRKVQGQIPYKQTCANSRSRLRGPFMKIFGENLTQLNEAYDRTIEAMRTMKKQLDKMGNEYWKGDFGLNRYCKEREEMAKIQKCFTSFSLPQMYKI